MCCRLFSSLLGARPREDVRDRVVPFVAGVLIELPAKRGHRNHGGPWGAVLGWVGHVALVQKARGHRDIRTTLAYTQVAVDPRLAEAVEKAFTLRPKARVRVAAPRGDARK